MAAKLSILSLFAVLASAPLGSCQNQGEQTIAGDGGRGLWGIPTEEYADMEVANATGVIQIWEGGYNLSIAVTADVPIANTSDAIMATTISLGMDQDVRHLPNCVAIYNGLSANASTAAIGLRTQEGSGCDSILTDECISDFNLAYSEELSENCTGRLPRVPESCRDQFSDNLSSSRWSIQSADEQILYQHASEPAAPGNDTLWLASAAHIWPIFISTIVVTENGWSAETSLSCLRPDTFKEGTVRPSAEPNGTQSGDAAGTGTTDGATPSPTNAASQAGLPVAAAVGGLIFNAAMLFM